MNETNYNNFYINNKRMKEKNSEEWYNYFFGICFGFVLFSLSLINFYISDGIKSYIFTFLMLISMLIMMIAIIYPFALKYIKKNIYRIINVISKIFVYFILTIIYILLVIPLGYFAKRKKTKIKSTNFVNYIDNNTIVNVNKQSFIYQLTKILRFFFNENYAIFIPTLIALIIIAIILVVAESNVVAPFIYTLF